MKRCTFMLSVCLLCCSFAGFSQQTEPCGTMDYLEQQIKKYPAIIKKMQEIEAFTRDYASKSGNERNNWVYTIPVVFHVVYKDTAQYVDTIRLKSQIKVLNEDYRRLNKDTANTRIDFKNVAADIRIEFCLAKTDPNGNSTNGMNYIKTTKASFSSTDDPVKFKSKGGADAWPTDQYLNIWICNFTNANLLGYAQFPGGGLASTDGVVISYKRIGLGATRPNHLGRTCSHEVGHWLNLYHTFQGYCVGMNVNTCATEGDKCCDTPPTAQMNYNCPPHVLNSCAEMPVNKPDQWENFMDYPDDSCMNMFSKDQSTRIRALFAEGGFRKSLLTSNGCQEILDASIKDIIHPKYRICVDTICPVVVLKNSGSDILYNATIKYQLVGNSLHTYVWTGLLLSGESDTIPLDCIVNPNNNIVFKVYCMRPNDTTDMKQYNDTMALKLTRPPDQSTPANYKTNFEKILIYHDNNGDNSTFMSDIKKVNHNKYITVGGNYFFDKFQFVALIDSGLKATWAKTITSDTTYNISFNKVEPVYDGGFIITGEKEDIATQRFNVFLMKIKSDGTAEWTREIDIDSAQADFGRDVKQTSDSGFIVLSSTNGIGGNGADDIVLLKFNKAGDLQWSKAYASILDNGQYVTTWNEDIPYTVVQNSSEKYTILATTHHDPLTYNYNIMLLQTSSDGTLEWIKGFYHNKNYNHIGYSLREISNFSYVIAGEITDNLMGLDKKGFIMQLDISSGNLEKAFQIKTTGNYVLLNDIEQDGTDFLVTGKTGMHPGIALYAAKLNSSYEIQYDWNYGGDFWWKNDEGKSIFRAHDGGYIIGGNTSNYSCYTCGSNSYLLKTDKALYSDCHAKPGCSTIEPLDMYPNYFIKDSVYVPQKVDVYTLNFNTIDILPKFVDSLTCPCPKPNFSYNDSLFFIHFTDSSQNVRSWLWDFGDGQTSTDQNPTHFYLTAGTYKVCLKVASLCGLDSICKNITLLSTIPTEDETQSMLIYPNPVKNELFIKILDPEIVPSNIRIFNIFGQIVFDIPANSSEDEFVISMKVIPNGMYYIEVLAKHERVVKKIQVLK